MHLTPDAVAWLAASADPLGRPTVLTVLWGLVQLGVVAAVVLASSWLGMMLWRRRVLARVIRENPERADELRREMRRMPVLRAPRPPRDPFARTCHVVVAPLGDGRPGESFWTAAPARHNTFTPGPDGNRQDAQVLLAPGVYMLVHCAGRIGAHWGEHVVLPARERAQAAQDHRGEGSALPVPGPIDRVPTPAGDGWRVTLAYPGGRMLTDTHIDHAGWGFIVGVLSTANHPRAVEILDHVLATWRWLPAQAGEGGSTRSA